MNAPAKGIGLTTLIALIRKEISDAGEIGPAGKDGEQGPKGERGPQGPKGNTGPAGKQGPKGNDGKQGKPGKDGKDGEDGVGIEDITQDGSDTMVITMTDGEVYEIELPKGENEEVRYNSAGGGGGSVNLKKYVEKPETDEGWMVYKLGEGWALATTDLIETNPAVTFRDSKGRYKSTDDISDLTNQLKVNRFIANELDAQVETLAKEAEMRRTKDDFLQEQINNISEKGYDDTGIRDDLAQEIADREQGDKDLNDKILAEADTRRKADEGLQSEINTLADTLANLDIPDLEGYATEEWVTGEINAIEFPETDLTDIEDRLDNIEEVLPKVPVIIEPVDIGQQICEITGSRPTGGSGKAGSVLIWKSQTGGPGSPFNEAKLVVPDINAVELGVRTIWWKQGDSVQRWDMAGGGWFTNGNVLHYSAVETSGNKLVDGEPIELYYVDPNSTTDELLDVISREESKADDAELRELIENIEFPETDLSDYYTKGEVDESQKVQDDKIDGLRSDLNQETIDRIKGDNQLQADIEEIALILSTLAKSVESGYWSYVGNGIPSQQGEFSLAFPDVTSEQNIVTFNEKDIDGKTHLLPNTVSVGDYLEIVDQEHPEEFGLWQVAKEPDGTGIFSIEVNLVQAGDTFDIGDKCEARFFSVSDELDMNDLDARYLKLSGGEMTGKLTTPDVEVKTRDYTTAKLYLHGHRDNSSATAAEIVMHNRYHANAKGTISWQAHTGNNGFFKFDDRAVFAKGQQTNAQGFTVKGYLSSAAPNGDLLFVYHNNNAQDAVLYKGKQQDDQDHLATTKWTVGKIETAIGNIEFPEPDLSDYVAKTGAQEMEGPLSISGKLNLDDTLNFGREHSVLARINPAGGTTQEIDLFEGNAGGQILKVDLQGATYRNAIEFESGPSSNKDVILRLDSNNGIRVHGLNADNTKIKSVGDPTENKDAANKQYVDDTLKAGVDGVFVSKVGGDDMQGPLKITNNPEIEGSRNARKIEVLDIKSGSENSSLNLGAKNTSVYIGDSQTTFVKPILVDDIGEKNEGHNVNFLNTTTAPRVEVKTGERVSEAVLLLEGHRTGTSNPAARITMSNSENDNAYGNLSWKGTDGQGWFEFNKDVDLSTHGLHSVTRIRMLGEKAICDGNTSRMTVGGNVEVKRSGNDRNGFVIKGKSSWDDGTEGVNNDGMLLQTYHNASDLDAIIYRGKQEADNHLATVGYVADQISKIDIPEADLSDYLPIDGSTSMTGALQAPRVNIKTADFGDGVLLVEGKRDNLSATAARLTLSNRYNSNAYGSLEWHASSSNNGYFKFTDKVKLAADGTADNELVTKGYVDSKAAGVGSLVTTSFRCMWKPSSSTDGYTFYTQQENGSAISSHQSTKFINIRLPTDFWTVRAGVVPVGRDTGYITIIDPANGQIVYSAQAILVSGGNTQFKVDCNRDLWTNNPTWWTENKNYLIRMESCFREK